MRKIVTVTLFPWTSGAAFAASAEKSDCHYFPGVVG
jgi:hypothetical protein